MKSKYYDGTKLLSLRDKNGEKPEIYICTGNRTGGKTTYFYRLAINRYIKNGSKFMLLYRFKNELDNVDDKFFKDIKNLFFNDKTLSSKKRENGVYCELFLGKNSCGYATAINCADSIKKLSHVFNDVDLMILDEFQSENKKYCSNEIKKFISIHTSVARGNGKQTRYVPVILISNTVDKLNPYFSALGITPLLNKKLKYLKGNGYVLEQADVESARKSLKESAFMKAFSNNEYVNFATENKYFNKENFITDIKSGKYIATIIHNNKKYCIRENVEKGILICGKNVDDSFPLKLSLTTEDHDINYILLKNNTVLIATFRYYYEKGCVRFHDLDCEKTFLLLVSPH